MEIKLRITHDLPLESGIGKTSGKEWRKKSYVGETIETYPKKVNFEVWNDAIEKFAQCEIDKTYVVHFDIESSEFNGRWYTRIKAWKVEDEGAVQPQPTTQVPVQPQQPQPIEAEQQFNSGWGTSSDLGDSTDLPF